jgi:hypothetical protein
MNNNAILETIPESDVNLLDEGNAVTLSNTFDVNQLAPADDDDANQDLYVCVSDPQEVGTGVTA